MATKKTQISQIDQLQTILNTKLEGSNLIDQIIPYWNGNTNKLDASIITYLRSQGIVEINGNLMVDGQFYTEGVNRVVPAANSAVINVDLNSGNVIEIDLANYTNGTVQPTISFQNAKESAKYTIKFLQGNVNTQINWTASSIKFSKNVLLSLSPNNDDIDIVDFLYDQNQFYGDIVWSSSRIVEPTPKYPILTKSGVEAAVGVYCEAKFNTATGKVTFYPTSDGTATGQAYFTDILSVKHSAFQAVTNDYDTPLTTGFQIVSPSQVVIAVVKGHRQQILVGAQIDTINYDTDTTISVMVEVTGKLTEFGKNIIGNSELIRGIDGVTPFVEDNGDGTYSITDGFGTEVTWHDGFTSSNYPVFTNTGLQSLTGIYASSGTTANGKITFYATTDGTNTGQALFDTIFSVEVFAIGAATTNNAQEAKWATGDALVNNKQIDVNVIKGKQLVIGSLGNTITTIDYVSTSTPVYVKVLGKLSAVGISQLQNFEPLRGPAGFSPIVTQVANGVDITDENGAVYHIYNGVAPELEGNPDGSITFTDAYGNTATLVAGVSPTVTPTSTGYSITDAFGNTANVNNGIDGFSPIVTTISNGITVTDKNNQVHAITNGTDGVSPDITINPNGYTITDGNGTSATISNGQTGGTYPIFTNTGLKTTVGMYVQVKNNTNTGRTIFYATSDGTTTGTPLFTTIETAIVTPILTTTTAINVPVGDVYEIRNNKEVETMLIRGTTAVVAGATVQFAQDTTIKVQVQIVGQLSAYGQSLVTANSGLKGAPGNSAVVNDNFNGSFTLTDGLGNSVTWYDGATLIYNRQIEFQLTEAATITWNMGNNTNAKVTLTANRNLSITNPRNGDIGKLRITQSGANHTLTLPASSKIQGVVGNVLTLGSGSQYIIDYYYDGATYYWYTPVQF